MEPDLVQDKLSHFQTVIIHGSLAEPDNIT